MATIQGIYVAIFGRPADPAGLAYWNTETNNGADLSKMISTLSATDEFKALYDGKSNTEIITAVYQSLFGRAPDAAGLAYYLQGLEDGTLNITSIAVSIVDGAQGGDKTIVDNKIVAADAFTASLDTQAEIDAYVGTDAANAGRAFLTPVNGDPATIPTQEAVDAAILTVGSPDGGQAPATGGGGGGGGGTSLPAVSSFDAATGTVTVTANADASLTISGGVLTLSATGFNSVVINAAEVQNIVFNNGSVLHSSAGTLAAVTNLASVSGAGKLDVQGVSFTNADGSKPAAERFEPSPSLDDLYGKVQSGFSVNGNEADTIKAIWDVLDDRYGVAGYSNEEINTDFINLGIRYVEYLDTGGSPFADLVAKADAGGRSQSMHDNLLGNLGSSAINSRFTDQDVRDGFLNRIADEYESRAYYDGNPGSVGNANHDAVRAFDYAKGWDRPDYIDKVMSGTIDASGIKNGVELFVGDGNTVSGFNIVRHEGEGVEIALKAKVRGGADYNPVDTNSDGIVEYNVDSGAQSATRAKWSFDFAVATGLNAPNQAKELGDYTFRAFVDVDPTAAVKYIVFQMQKDPGNAANTPWVRVNDDGSLDFTAGFADEEKDGGVSNAKISQNSVNFGFGFLFNNIDGDPATDGIQPYDYGAGVFDIEFKVLDGAAVTTLASNHIQVIVPDLVT